MHCQIARVNYNIMYISLLYISFMLASHLANFVLEALTNDIGSGSFAYDANGKMKALRSQALDDRTFSHVRRLTAPLTSNSTFKSKEINM